MATNGRIWGLPEMRGERPGTTRLLRIKIIAGVHLAKKDIFGASDPYVRVVSFRGDRDSGQIDSVCTKTIKKSLNPKWEEEFIFRVNARDNVLMFEVFDENRVTRDDFLGLVEIPLSQALISTERADRSLLSRDFILRPRSSKSRVRGHLRLYLAYVREEDDPVVDETQPQMEVRRPDWEMVDLDSALANALGSAPTPSTPSSTAPPQNMSSEEDVSSLDEYDPMTPVADRRLSSQQSNAMEEGVPEDPPPPATPPVAGSASSSREPMPPGWEERRDAQERVFYVNHSTRTTQWERPTMSGTGSNIQSGWEERTDASGRTYYVDHNTHTTQWQRPTVDTAQNQQQMRVQAAEMFRRRRVISQEDTLSLAGSTLEDLSGAMGRTDRPEVVRESSTTTEPEEEPLPPGWAMSVTQNGRVFYIDHNTKATAWDDPRKKHMRPRAVTSLSLRDLPQSNELLRPSSNEDLTRNLGSLPPAWEERVHQDGRIFFINHKTRATTWDDPRLQTLGGPAVKYNRDYKRKYDYFRSKLRKPPNVPNKFEIKIRREHILEDSYRVIMTNKRPELFKTRLWIEFDGEAGLDYGGVAREWFYLLSKEMFNPYYGLFEYSAIDDYTLQINPQSGLANEEHLSYYKYIGRVVGMAVFHGKLVDAYFIRPFYKMMLGKRIKLDDMESVDPEYHNSLKWILENDPSCLELYFAVDEEVFGETKEIELKPGGSDIPVNEDNKKEYIDCVIEWRFSGRIQSQMKAFMEGFNELIPHNLLTMFDSNEVEMLLAGLQDVDVNDWKKHTAYRGEAYNPNHPVIVHFWRAVYSFNNEMRSRLLQFVTGTSRVPMNGFKELYGSNGPQLFTIEKWGKNDNLPRAHTCFNRIDLPPYDNYDELRRKLIIAVENAEGFEGVD